MQCSPGKGWDEKCSYLCVTERIVPHGAAPMNGSVRKKGNHQQKRRIRVQAVQANVETMDAIRRENMTSHRHTTNATPGPPNNLGEIAPSLQVLASEVSTKTKRVSIESRVPLCEICEKKDMKPDKQDTKTNRDVADNRRRCIVTCIRNVRMGKQPSSPTRVTQADVPARTWIIYRKRNRKPGKRRWCFFF